MTKQLLRSEWWGHLCKRSSSASFSFLLGEAILAASLPLFCWSPVFATANAVCIPLSEEPGLIERFGKDYEAYRRNVPGWIPRGKPWAGEATRGDFSGFVFKIQANLDPRHQDRVAFVRVCSGRFHRDMEVFHPRTGKKLRLTRAHRVFGQDRETMNEAYPGDVIGLVNPGGFQLGDTICEGPPINFEPLPQFSREHFAILRTPDTSRRKQFHRGLAQLIEEGAIQLFRDPQAMRREPMLAAVGELQFDVVRYRLENEYNTPTEIQWLPDKLAR